MKILGRYSFNGGLQAIRKRRPSLLSEVEAVVGNVRSEQCKSKTSREKTMPGRVLYNPRALNACFVEEFARQGWTKQKVSCEYPREYYVEGYQPPALSRGAFREMDFLKNKVGVEVQFGKYAFMVYNVCAKMTIFHRLGFIDWGVEIVPVKEFADEMSTGVSYFEQFVWDLEKRGVSDIDIPVLVLGVGA